MEESGTGAAASVHVLLIPFLGRSRALTMTATACLLAKRGGFRCTIVTTPSNSSYILPSIKELDNVELQLVPFPAADVGLPAGVECTDVLYKSHSFASLYQAMKLLRHPIEALIVDRRFDVLVFDLTLFWFGDVAKTHSIPFFLLDTTSPFPRALFNELMDRGGDIKMGGPLAEALEIERSEVPVVARGFPGLFEVMEENDRMSCGVLLNSFEELTPHYVEHCRNMSSGIFSGAASKFFCIGPVQLAVNGDEKDGVGINDNMIIKKWLDSKPRDSVLYVSFGSECLFSSEQLREIAIGLQSCQHSFIWVVKGDGGGAETMDEWLPREFYNSVGERGLIVTEWVPQFAILNHPATGGFLTHCGWRSTLEAVCAGLPVIPWPLHAEQFINERLLIQILQIGVRIMNDKKMRTLDPKEKGLVNGSLIKNAVDRLLGGTDEEARAMRQNANKYKELARSAVAEGGSSYANLNHVIEKMQTAAKEKQVVDES